MQGRTLVVALALVAIGQGQIPEAQAPLAVDKTERVEVRLVLIDALVLDRGDRTVPGLTRQDFEVIVEGDLREIDTLDVACSGTPLDDPRGVADVSRRPRPAAAPEPRQLVLAFDYMHMSQIQRLEVLLAVQEVVRHGTSGDEEIMVAALTDRLRVEQPFSVDRERTLVTLQRMENDLTLWSRRFDHLHELRWFDLLTSLLDILGTRAGSKAVVLYSDLLGVADEYDPQYALLATTAATVRARFYPVLARGLEIPHPNNPFGQPTGGPPALARIAVDSGGRLTRDTNDLSLGYARAQRDLACRYTVGFYEPRDDGREKRVHLRVRRPGARVIHPGTIAPRTAAEAREALRNAALLAPEAFASPRVTPELELLGDRGRRKRKARVRFRLPAGDPKRDAPAAYVAIVQYMGPTELDRFERDDVRRADAQKIRLRPRADRVVVLIDHPSQERPETGEIVIRDEKNGEGEPSPE